MTDFGNEAVEIAALRAKVSQQAVELADLSHFIRIHALHGIAEARERIEHLRCQLPAGMYDAERATLAVIDAELATVAEVLRKRDCPCGYDDRVSLEVKGETPAEVPIPGRVVPLRRMALVRKPVRKPVRDLLDAVARAMSPKKPDDPGGAA